VNPEHDYDLLVTDTIVANSDLHEGDDAQLAVGIGSPYQLILSTQESVESLLRGNTSKEKLEKVIGANVDRVFAKSTAQVRKEITNYLVRYYIKSKTL
jgi:hypothetical protein